MWPGMSGWKIAAAIIIIAGLVAVVLVVLPAIGIALPPIFITLFWIVLAVIAGLVAIGIIASFWNRLP
jgi:hypothetical protein